MEEIKFIPSRIALELFELQFEYDTKRKNHKIQTRKILQTNREAAERDFWIWISTTNNDTPHRSMLNAKILSIKNMGVSTIKLISDTKHVSKWI